MATSETTPPALNLRAVARLHEIDRRQYQIMLARAGMRFVVFPGAALCGFLIVQRIIGLGVMPATAQLLRGAVMVTTAAGAMIHGVRATRAAAARLEEERAEILAGTADGPFRLTP